MVAQGRIELPTLSCSHGLELLSWTRSARNDPAHPRVPVGVVRTLGPCRIVAGDWTTGIAVSEDDVREGAPVLVTRSDPEPREPARD